MCQYSASKKTNNLNTPTILILEITLLKFHKLDTQTALNFSKYFMTFLAYCYIRFDPTFTWMDWIFNSLALTKIQLLQLG